MAKKNSNSAESPEEKLPEKQTMAEVVAEGYTAQADAEKKADEEAKKVEEEAKIPEVEVDLDAEREKTKKEVTDSVTKDVVEPLKQEIQDLKKTLNPVEKDDYDKFVDDYTEKNGKAPEWKQVATFLEDRAIARIDARQKEADEKKKQEEEATKKTQEETSNANFKIWQGQLEELESKGLLPKMVKPEVGDKGFDARVKLYGHMQNTWNTTTPLSNMWEVHAKYYTQPETQPAGADAPVSIGTGTVSQDNPSSYKYSDIHNGGRDLEGFLIKTLKESGNS